MSAQSEFQRVLADLVAFLVATGDPACAASAAELDACALIAQEDLSAGASRAREACASATVAGLSQAQAREHGERCAHLLEICRSLLG